MAQFGRDLLAHLRQLLVIRTMGEVPDTFSVTAADPERLRLQAEAFSDLALMRAIDAIAAALAAIKEGDEPRMTLELALLRAARPDVDPSRARPGADDSSELERLVTGHETARSRTPREQPEDNPGPSPRWSSRGGWSAGRGGRTSSGSSACGRRCWTRSASPGSELLSTVFAAARPVAVDVEQAVLEVGFPASAAFNKRKAEAKEARERLADAVKTIVGERLRPVYVLLEGEEEVAAEAAEPQLSEEELIERLKSEFDAEEFDEPRTQEEAEG